MSLVRQRDEALQEIDVLTTKLDQFRERNCTLVAANQALQKRVKRFSERLKKATSNAVEDVVNQSSKEKRIITPAMRLCVLELAKHGVPMDHIAGVILAVSDCFGIHLDSAPSSRSCRRIVKEGGIIDELHTMDLMNHTEYFTLSGDGTSYKNLNYEVKHVTLTDYLADPSLPEAERKHVVLVDLSNTASHTSEAQLAGWKNLCYKLHDTYNTSPLGLENPIDNRTFYTKACGYLSDHAPDQTKLVRLFVAERDQADLEMRGEQVLKSLGGEELVQMVVEQNETNILLAGGVAQWDALSQEEKETRNTKVEHAIIKRVGREAFEKLPKEQQADSRRFVWGGCAMHKAINSSKGGPLTMILDHRHPGPITLFNKDNAAAAGSSDAALKARAEKLSGRGGVKLIELMGMVLNNSNKKLGQQDMHGIYFESREHLGHVVRFPDVIIAHLPLYIEFFKFIREHKASGQWTNIEQNIYTALHDDGTLSDLVCMTLYSQSVDIPYMVIVRGQIQNQLDLPPTHDKVKALCRRVIADPYIVCGLDMSYKMASLNGKQWQRPDAVYAALALIPRLPLIPEGTKATFEGALETWERFTEDERSAQRVGMTEKQKMDHFLRTTNDHSEGGAGTTKRAKQRAPNASMDFISAKARWTRNNPKVWVEQKEQEVGGLFKHARVIVRRDDADGVVQRKRKEIAEQSKEIANANTCKRMKTKARKDKKQQELELCVPIEDMRALTEPARLKTITIAALDLQIDWHRDQEQKVLHKQETKAHSTIKGKPAKAAAVIAAIKQRKGWVTSGLIKEFYTPIEPDSDDEEVGSECNMDVEDDADIVGYGG
ncbi:hypothetical protein CPB85DRAFT_1418086 [Mucidula mucida]|nr:hypothetical protein CPB85DRAFT_1418086 [Mucidula mucida]